MEPACPEMTGFTKWQVSESINRIFLSFVAIAINRPPSVCITRCSLGLKQEETIQSWPLKFSINSLSWRHAHVKDDKDVVRSTVHVAFLHNDLARTEAAVGRLVGHFALEGRFDHAWARADSLLCVGSDVGDENVDVFGVQWVACLRWSSLETVRQKTLKQLRSTTTAWTAIFELAVHVLNKDLGV